MARRRPQFPKTSGSASITGVLIYDGPSMLTGEHIVCILTFGSLNKKTGGMAQTTILRPDVTPGGARSCGADVAMCGFCPQRPFLGGGCYVSPKALSSAWQKLQQPSPYGYPSVPYGMLDSGLFDGLNIRIGTYGDPAAVPLRIWLKLLGGAIGGWTGYTHLWRDFPDFKDFCMASVDSPEEAVQAQRRGWRTFRTRPVSGHTPLLEGEFICFASPEHPKARKLQCYECLLCSGTRGRVVDPFYHPVIVAHGARKKRHVSLGGLSGWLEE